MLVHQRVSLLMTLGTMQLAVTPAPGSALEAPSAVSWHPAVAMPSEGEMDIPKNGNLHSKPMNWITNDIWRSGDPRTKTQLQLTINTTSYYWFQMVLGHEHRMLVGGQEDMSKKRMARATPDDYVRQAPSSTQRQVGSTLDRTALMSCQASFWHGKIMERQQNHRLKIKGVPWGLFWIVLETMVMNITEHHQLGCEWCGPRNSPRPKKKTCGATYFAPIAPMSSTWGTRYGYHLGTPQPHPR